MATVLLAHPLFLAEDEAERASASSYFPLGILYLASYVRERGHTVAVFDGTFAADRTAFDEALQAILASVRTCFLASSAASVISQCK